MPSPSGTSVPDPGRWGGARGWRRALLIVAALFVCLAIVPLHTRDSRGIRRDRTAVEIWRVVPARLPALPTQDWTRRLFWLAMGTAVASMAGLLVHASRAAGTAAIADGHRPSPDDRPPATIARAAEIARARLTAPPPFPDAARWCAALLLALALVAAWQTGLFRRSTIHGLPDTFASIDHPFHIVRAESLRRSLAEGVPLRWVSQHQGGYPVEFYPLGFAYGEVLLWLLLLGVPSMLSVHKLAVLIAFLAPLPLFWTLARRDGWPPIVAVVAGAVQVAVPGGIWHGGYNELVLMGLVSNVTAATLVFAAFAAMLPALMEGRGRMLALSGVAAGGALWVNPRSALPLAIAGLAVWLVAVARTPSWRAGRLATTRLLLVALLAGLLAAPELQALWRFGQLYHFIRMTAYSGSLDYLAASIDAVSLPLFACAAASLVLAPLVPARHSATRATALALLLYAAMTAAFSFDPRLSRLIPQLETTRLMPLQRLLTIYLAAVGIHLLASLIVRRTSERHGVAIVGLQAGAVALILLTFVAPTGALSPAHTGLHEVDRFAVPASLEMRQQVEYAARHAPPGTAVLVIGSRLSGHQQLWAPLWAPNRPFFYDNWLWYWHTRHAGPYNPRATAWYDAKRLKELFTTAYLQRHAIGAIIVAEEQTERLARKSGIVQQVTSGPYAVYTVPAHTSIVSCGSRAPERIDARNHRVDAELVCDRAEMVVRRNWHPRWQATVNGASVPIRQRADGYMTMAAPIGRVRLVLRYEPDGVDRSARVAALIGIAGSLALGLRRARGEAPRPHGAGARPPGTAAAAVSRTAGP